MSLFARYYSLLLGGGGGGGGLTLDGGGLTFGQLLIPSCPVDGLGGGGLEPFLPIFSLLCLFHKFNPFYIFDVYHY